GRSAWSRRMRKPSTCTSAWGFVRSCAACWPPSMGLRRLGDAMACEWLLIDGSSLIFRAYYGALARARVSAAEGNAIGGFVDRLARLVIDRQPRRLVIAEDRAWRPQWRVDRVPDYKAHRVTEPVPPGLVPH